MNTTEFGDVLEKQIYEYFIGIIADDVFWAKKEHCKVFWKKGYHSVQRKKKIIFDVSIEVWTPGADRPSLLILIECKRYTNRRVPVGDIEQFFQKVQQVSSGNRKAILVSNAAFDSGTRTFAESNGIALLRYPDRKAAKWELHRPSRSIVDSPSEVQIEKINEALSQQDLTSQTMDLYILFGTLRTSSFWDLARVLITSLGLSTEQIRELENPRGKPKNQVRFLDDETLEERAWIVLREIEHQEGEVSLGKICTIEQERTGLKVTLNALHDDSMQDVKVLGKISFSPLEILVFEQETPNIGRERFTLAHELAHYLLGHSEFLSREFCDESDFRLGRASGLLGPEISRLEYQANVFAACLLMPRRNFLTEFERVALKYDIQNRGFGRLYVDEQECNCQHYYLVTNALMRIFGVSRAAVTIRLKTFGLLHDVRRTPEDRSPISFLLNSFARFST